MSDRIDVLLYGLGAIGSFYAFILQRCERVRLTVVARSNYEAVKSNGVFVNSANHGQHHFHPYKVVKSPAELTGKSDFVVCAHKAINPEATPAALAPVVGDNTTIVIIQNGVGNEEPFRRAFPTNSILTCVAWVGASQPTPGTVHHTVAENTQIGLFTDASSPPSPEGKTRLATFAALLQEGGTNVDVVDDIQRRRWEKVSWNAAWNAITSLTRMDTQDWLASSPDAVSLSQRLILEVVSVGRACGVSLPDGLEEEFITRARGLGRMRTSMQYDCEHERPMEIEVILGYPARKARELGVDAPVLQTLYALLRAVDGRFAAGVVGSV
ncbi:putative ketopantoate reductase family protein [Aspergillus campestris IBT 28561]|uniref:2-dehydropantoate 2-reductase n=1 Tax=Aspergillus campestris (strain IBT 28561) TaxID=1392248 RepID=A0A2I1DFK4_ASPC2|nr:putative ketopantoate reductase family protein [Aspergillus campestris IBT 28561]PKY08654.1 putative ketopantoate reductase family protein [Aspergillus campestris IBT 28561]